MKKTYFTVKRNKYNNRSSICSEGHWHHSNGEAQYCSELALRVRAGDIKSYEKQVKFELKVNGVKICSYYVDFVITHNDLSRQAIEYKGFETEVFKIKEKLFRALYPELDYQIIYHKEPYNIFRKTEAL